MDSLRKFWTSHFPPGSIPKCPIPSCGRLEYWCESVSWECFALNYFLFFTFDYVHAKFSGLIFQKVFFISALPGMKYDIIIALLTIIKAHISCISFSFIQYVTYKPVKGKKTLGCWLKKRKKFNFFFKTMMKTETGCLV